VFDRANMTGGLGGGQLGFNYQVANWVFGIEGDYSWADIKGDESSVSPLITTHTISNSKLTWLATATGRVGYAWNNWLPYVKGGAAWTHNDANTSTINMTRTRARSTPPASSLLPPLAQKPAMVGPLARALNMAFGTTGPHGSNTTFSISVPQA
jgi:hypothetical protein